MDSNDAPCHQGHAFNTSLSRLGLGTENVVKVRTDSSGRMIPEELESEIRKSIRDGKTPMMVNATAGSTVCGSYDDLVKKNYSGPIHLKLHFIK